MVVGAIAQSNRQAARAVELIARQSREARVSCSVDQGIAIATIAAGDGTLPAVFSGDHAYVGALKGDLPSTGTELRGDFALVARAGSSLRLARGRFAGRPIYWLRIGSTTVACSRLLPLAILAGREARLNVDHVLSVFDAKFSTLCGPLPVLGAERVRANTVVDVDASGHASIAAGSLRFGPELRLSDRELAGALRDEFEEAVARQCAGARRVAVFSGGGVDSSNLLAVAVGNERYRETAKVVPIAFDFGGPGDDRPHLRAVCSHLGIEALRVTPAEGLPYAGLDRIVDGFTHTHAPVSVMLSAMALAKSEGAELVLTGEGVELLLDSDAAVFGDFLLSSPLQALRCASRFSGISYYESRPRSWRRLVLGPLLRRTAPRFAMDLRARRIALRTTRRRIRDLPWAGPRLKDFLTTRRDYPGSPPILSQRDRVTRLASSELLMATRENTSRWEIAGGLPIVLPYLDDDFAMFAARIPSAAIFAGARERGLLRESMEGLVPDTVRYRMDKSRLDQAFSELFSAMGGARAVDDLLTMRELGALDIVDASRFRSAFERFAADPDADPAGWTTLWAPITAEAHVRWFQELRAASSSGGLSLATATS